MCSKKLAKKTKYIKKIDNKNFILHLSKYLIDAITRINIWIIILNNTYFFILYYMNKKYYGDMPILLIN